MSKRFLIGAVAIAALALAAAGCGGGGGGKLTKDEYVSKLNAICEDFNAEQEEIGEPESLEEIGDKGGRILDAFDDAIAEAEDLEAPDEIKETADQFIAKGKEQVSLLRDLVAAAKINDLAKINQLGTEASKLDDESDALAEELEVAACAED